jgi:hypothetical protein
MLIFTYLIHECQTFAYVLEIIAYFEININLKEPMKGDHLSFNFDVHFAHELLILLVIVMLMS